MKKIKMILTAVAIFAVVGGALAFKSSTFSARNIYCLAPGTIPNDCPVNALVSFKVNSLGSTGNPCGGTFTPHINFGIPHECLDVNGIYTSPALGSN